MIVLEQMQHTHPCSSVFRGIFLGAIRYIFPNYVAQTVLPELASDSSPPQEVPADDSLAGITIGGESATFDPCPFVFDLDD